MLAEWLLFRVTDISYIFTPPFSKNIEEATSFLIISYTEKNVNTFYEKMGFYGNIEV